MKQMFKTGALALLSLAAFAACSDSDDSGAQKTYQVTTNISLAEALADGEDITDAKLVFQSATRSDTIDLDAAAQSTGGISVSKENGKYTVTTTERKGQYTVTFTGRSTVEATTYYTGATSVDLYSNQTISLTASKVTKSSLVFKTLYTTGGAQYYMLDGYFEIVNNSDEVQYLDQLILSAPTGNAKQANAWQANGITDLYECGQGTVIAFPGSGHDYPLQPGEFVVIANEATNHKLAYGDDESKKDDYAKSPDLSNADWEIYLGTGDVDYEAPNMEVIFSNNKYMKAFGLGLMGRSYILAKLPAGVTPQQFAADESNIQTTPGTSSSMTYLMIPSKYVLDAVDIYNPSTAVTDHYCTFLPKDDATGVQGSKSYTGKCIRRKVSSIVNGRVYYQDTNSSAADFKNEQDNTPRLVPTSVD